MKDNWEQEVVDAVIGANEHMSHAIDLILEQVKKPTPTPEDVEDYKIDQQIDQMRGK